MTTINTADDLVALLQENDEFRNAVMRELLTQELLALPAVFDAFVSEMRGETGEIRGETGEIRGEMGEIRGEMGEIRGEMGEIRTGVRRNADNIGEVKGLLMERAVREDAPVIASDMGLEWKKSLERNDVVAIADEAVREGRATGISRDNMRRFRRTDLVIEATDYDDTVHYVIVEISYTADSRDTDRAIRHAEYITRFTGVPAYAAISSVYIDNRIGDILTEDSPKPLGVNQKTKVFWSRSPELELPN